MLVVAVAEKRGVQALFFSQSLIELFVAVLFLLHVPEINLVHILLLVVVELLAENLPLHGHLLITIEHGFVEKLLAHLHPLGGKLFLVDLGLGTFGELSLLMFVTVVNVVINRSLDLLVSQNHVAFIFLPASIELLVLFFELDLVCEFLEVLMLVIDLLDSSVLLLLLVSL